MPIAVDVITPPASPKPARAEPLFHQRTKTRWPPMANRNALPYKLTTISKEKLTKEATAPDPDLRRCVAHFRLHCGSVLWTENDMKSRMSAFEFEETDSEDETDSHDQADEKPSNNAFVTVQVTESDKAKKDVPSPPISTASPIEMDTKNNFCAFTVQPIGA